MWKAWELCLPCNSTDRDFPAQGLRRKPLRSSPASTGQVVDLNAVVMIKMALSRDLAKCQCCTWLEVSHCVSLSQAYRISGEHRTDQRHASLVSWFKGKVTTGHF